MSWVILPVLSQETYAQNVSLKSQNSNQSNQGGKARWLGFFCPEQPNTFHQKLLPSGMWYQHVYSVHGA